MAGSLESTVGRLEVAQQQNRQFVADVSHELRTPLTALVAEASLIEGHVDGLAPEPRRAAELMVGDIRRLRTLVDDLMEVSRFDADAEHPFLEPVDLGRVVTAIVGARLPGAELTVPAAGVIVESDPRRLDRIVGNLLDNARDHAPGASVEVAVTRTMDGALVVVADRGPGVPPDALQHLFDRFYKADPSRRGGSSGLGLAIAAEHAALLGGTLRARRRPGGGLVFVLTIPVTSSLPAGDAQDTGRATLRRTRTTVRDRAVIRRQHSMLTLLVIVTAATLAACAPGTGALGTPATPAISSSPSEDPGAVGRHARVGIALGWAHRDQSPSPPSSPSAQPTPDEPTRRPTATPSASPRRPWSCGPTSCSAASPTTRASSRCSATCRRPRPWRPPPCERCWPDPTLTRWRVGPRCIRASRTARACWISRSRTASRP